MNFREAYEQLLLDKAIRRKAWDKSVYLLMTVTDVVKCYREEAVPFSYDINIINSHDWLIVGDEKDKMLFCFSEMVEMLAQGRKAKLPEWPDDCFIEATPNGKEVFMRRVCEYDFTPTFECFTSDDWIVVE